MSLDLVLIRRFEAVARLGSRRIEAQQNEKLIGELKAQAAAARETSARLAGEVEVANTKLNEQRVALTETDAALTATGSMSLYDVDTTNLVTASVQSVAISGVSSGLTLTNDQVKALLTVSTTDSNALQLSKVNWSFNSGSETFDWLAAGEELTFTYTIEVNDNQGATSTSTVTVQGGTTSRTDSFRPRSTPECGSRNSRCP